MTLPKPYYQEGRVKERPILFSGPMVRAILDGSKTQTRRVAKLTPSAAVKEPGGHRRWHPADPEAVAACPYGIPGDHLWVRETWAPHPDDLGALYQATDPGWDDNDSGLLWKHSIHMPRWASRITLEITGVRVQRVQEISVADAMAEGPPCCCNIEREHHRDCSWTDKEHFRQLWDSINAKRGYGWDVNPWVWALTFKRTGCDARHPGQ